MNCSYKKTRHYKMPKMIRRCNFCFKTFNRTANMRMHMANMHRQELMTSSAAAAAVTTKSTAAPSTTVQRSTSLLTSGTGQQSRHEQQQRPRYDELVNDSPIFEHGCEVPECERCFRYFNSVEELRKHEEVKIFIRLNFTPSERFCTRRIIFPF